MIKNNKRTLKTGKDWASFFSIEFVNKDSWFDEQEFNEKLLSRTEFLNLASNCTIIPPSKKSRREASRYKEILHKNTNE